MVTRVHGPSIRPFFLPPGTPKERVLILRKAYMDTMKDLEFLADTKKAKLDLNPDDGAGLERNVKEIFDLEPSLVAKAKGDSQIASIYRRSEGGVRWQQKQAPLISRVNFCWLFC